MKHSGRAHSKFSASGSERWFNCPGSVQLSEGIPSRDTVWSIEGTKAHEVLEQLLRDAIQNGRFKTDRLLPERISQIPNEMKIYGITAADFILGFWERNPHSEILVESRIYLDFIHPEMFGTFDGAIIDHFGTLHVFDYKYGAGHAVSPEKNLQMIFYGIGLAHRYDWNFSRVRLWIVQPRIKGYDGPTYWEIEIQELMRYVKLFRAAVERVLKESETFKEGSHCHWCVAKGVCPLKRKERDKKAFALFSNDPL